MRITIISSTNRPNSNSLKVVRIIQEQLATHSKHEVSIIDLAELETDILFSSQYGKAEKSKKHIYIQNEIKKTDYIIFVIPEYNNSFPGVLKMFLDGMDYPSPFKGKNTALIGISSGPQGGIIALSHFTDVLHYLECDVHHYKLKIPYIEKSIESGSIHQLLDSKLKKIILH